MNNPIGLKKFILASLAASFFIAVIFPFVASADYRWVNSSTIEERRQTGQHSFEHERYYALAEGSPLSVYSNSVGGAVPFGAQFNTQPVEGYCRYHIQVGMEGTVNLVTNKRTSGSCDAQDKYTTITVKNAKEKVPIHAYLDKAGTIKSVHVDKNNTAFSSIRSTSIPDSIKSATEEVYYQSSPENAACPAILFKYKESGNWGFLRPKKHETTKDDKGSAVYREILGAAGLGDVYGGCEVSGSSGSNGGRGTTEKGLEELVYGDLNFWNEHNGNNYVPCSNKWVSFLDIWSSSVYCLGASFVGTADDAPFSSGEVDYPDGAENPSGDEVTTCAIDGIGWIICPVMNFLGNIADGSFNFLSGSFLETNSSIARADDGNPVYEAWKAMRNLANALFVIAFIIIVYSQMTGAGISNYGVKRMLPRLVMAAVLVNVSFFICQLAVDLSNVLGYSLKNFFEGLAANATGGVRPDISVDATGAGGVGFFGGLVAAVLISGSVYLFASALFPILLGAVVALVMILFILLARQALIILLIVVAPVAFVAFLLPNTQKLFTQWRKAFTAVMMVFPIIGVVFGVSMFASAVITAASNPVGTGVESSFWGQIIGAGIAVLPLFVVPGILKKSLDGVGNIGARINSIGGRLQGAANKKGAAAYGNSRLAQFKNYRAQNAARRRTLVQSGAYEGKWGKANPRNWANAANKKINQSNLSGRFGDRSVAKGAAIINKEQEELLNEEMATYEARPLTKLQDAKTNFDNAVASGDSLKASAAIRVLASMKTKGADEIKGLLEKHGDKMPTEVMSATRSMLAGNADPVLNAMSFLPGSYQELRDDPKTYRSLNAEKVAGMSAASIKHAMKIGGLDSQIVSSLLSPESRHSLTTEQREALGGDAFRAVAQAQVDSQSKPESGSLDLRTRADSAEQGGATPEATPSPAESAQPQTPTDTTPPPQSGPTFIPPA